MIVATAGHVDHGKTAIVRALTGVDTDRLPEEKKRGLTIDLGFAYQQVDEDHTLGFVDVPGHERFVRNMLAGVGAVDLALLVVAADDGVMPQTIEHTAILDLLGVRECIALVSKTDKVDKERVAQVKAQVEALLSPTGMRKAEILGVSAHSGSGMEALAGSLRNRARRLVREAAQGLFRLCVDRAFTIKGAGLVVTGSVHAGSVGLEERLLSSPGGYEVRIRGIHVGDRPADRALAGERCALNLSGRGLDAQRIARGSWIVDPLLHAPTDRIDARLRILPGEHRPLRHWTPVHAHLAAGYSPARIAILEGGSIAPGESARVQLVLERPVHALVGDRLVIRDQSALRTMGGGAIIDPFSPVRGRARPARLAWLEAIEAGRGLAGGGDDDGLRASHEASREEGSSRGGPPGESIDGFESEAEGANPQTADPHLPARRVIERLLADTPSGVDRRWMQRSLGLPDSDLEEILQTIEAVRVADAGFDSYFSTAHWAELQAEVVAFLERFHRERPQLAGAGASDIRSGLGRRLMLSTLERALVMLAHRQVVVRRGMMVRLPTHRIVLGSEDRALWERIEPILDPAHGSPPGMRQVAERLKIEEKALRAFFKRVGNAGLTLPVTPTRFLSLAAIESMAKGAQSLARSSERGQFTAAEYKDSMGIGRNFAIELLEFFDRSGLTERIGDHRRLRGRADEIFGESASRGL
ncbi:selenocysteine-specific translation elongation factor [Thioalkalivibrio sp. HK1]|uniref:selenocysteine-specific translation elongation factor n=1 Tax=Thioalkalivibrio sp. HK1 TaxID=1469245 RepID=UPI0004711DAD|nr:selenocysteine-specific translation elongation factor [Thioalkalivibrio sp. HK1]